MVSKCFQSKLQKMDNDEKREAFLCLQNIGFGVDLSEHLLARFLLFTVSRDRSFEAVAELGECCHCTYLYLLGCFRWLFDPLILC